MRVATKTFYEGVQQRISRLSSELNEINKKISSGRNINRPSDDPLGLIDSLGLKSTLSQADQYLRNLEMGKSWLNLIESAMDQSGELVGRAIEIGIQTANDTQSPETRAQAAIEVGHLLDQAIALGNTQLGGYYIFAGYETLTPPFSKVVVGGIETAQYNGDGNDFNIQIGKNETIAIGKNGQTVFINSSLFDILGTLKKALEDNDVATVRLQLDNLKTAGDYLQNHMADAGAKANRIEGKESALTTLRLNLKDRLSQVEDTDLAELVTELRAKELAYEAALMSAVKITELSLINFLR
ncbi:MAG: flagellar hook-associated protein 3 [Deltaproteobacteria bacterium]|nr:flagellar hook-associated protein 3 [Deltaproteobacteria bacterium]